MPSHYIEPIAEKGGDKILRMLSETFTPFCTRCNRVVAEMQLETEVEARRALGAHKVVAHHENIEQLNLAISE